MVYYSCQWLSPAGWTEIFSEGRFIRWSSAFVYVCLEGYDVGSKRKKQIILTIWVAYLLCFMVALSYKLYLEYDKVATIDLITTIKKICIAIEILRSMRYLRTSLIRWATGPDTVAVPKKVLIKAGKSVTELWEHIFYLQRLQKELTLWIPLNPVQKKNKREPSSSWHSFPNREVPSSIYAVAWLFVQILHEYPLIR
mgnify:CR=1 FL=1